MTTRNLKFHQIIVISMMGIFVFGCSNPTPIPAISYTPSIEQMDKSPFTGVPCSAPCWQGLEVGKTHENEVIVLLPTLTFIDQNAIQMFRTSMPNYDFTASALGVNIIANCIDSDQECLNLKIVDDILTKIVVVFNYKIKADEGIGYLGNPDYIGVAPIGGEYFVCEVYLVWIDNGFALVSTFDAQKSIESVEKYCDAVYETGKIPSSMLLLEARYLSPAELGAIMSPESSNTFFEFTGTSQQ